MANGTLQNMLVQARMRLRDLTVRTFQEPLLVAALNEGKNELVKIIKQARENFFESTGTGTITAVAKPNPSDITLPTDFAELRQLAITTAGFEDIGFVKQSQSHPLFVQALLDGGSFGTGQGMFYYDFVGLTTLRLAPGSDTDLAYRIDYISMVADMTKPDDYPVGIPSEHYDFIVTWAIADCLRSIGDPKLIAYENKLKFQAESVMASVGSRQVREPRFVRAFMEEEGW